MSEHRDDARSQSADSADTQANADELDVRPGPRDPLHPSITREQISILVDDFYELVWKDERLGPIFAGELDGKRPEHLAKMKTFWESVLLKTGAYKGRPVPAHMKLQNVEGDDFKVWLGLFRKVANNTFHPDAAPHVIETAERIASSLWLAMFGNPFNAPPQWRPEPTRSTA
ncbi:MAG: group III truncated hemoglobin [Filomicrobium sp.]